MLLHFFMMLSIHLVLDPRQYSASGNLSRRNVAYLPPSLVLKSK